MFQQKHADVSAHTKHHVSGWHLGRATPRPHQQVWGQKDTDLNNPVGSVTAFGFYPSAYTNEYGRYDLQNARLNAQWFLQTEFNPPCYQTYPVPAMITLFEVTTPVTTDKHDPTFECATREYGSNFSPGFVLSSALPSVITVQASDQPVSTGSGMPVLFLYNRSGAVAATITASSYTSTTASFPASPLGSLGADIYGAALVNNGSYPLSNYLGKGWLSIGHDDQSYPGAFGVGAQTTSTSWSRWGADDPYGDGTCAGEWVYDSGSDSSSFPVVTQYQLNQVKGDGAAIPVGVHPTAIALYGSQVVPRYEQNGPCHWYYSETTQLTRAIVANSGSNTVSILDIVNNAVLSTIAVGSQPVALRVSPDASRAYVVNYGSGTVSMINLTSYGLAATAFVGAQPAAIDLDAGGNPVIGGAGYVVTLDPNSLAITSTQQVSGSITAVAVSQAKNQILTSGTSGSGYGQTATMVATNTAQHTQAFSTGPISTAPYMLSGISGSLAFSSQLASGIIVSPVLNNGFAAVATSTGFQITDLETGEVLLAGNTPHPVRGMAIDSTAGNFYFTMPDSNSVVTVPIPTVPLDPGVAFLN